MIKKSLLCITDLVLFFTVYSLAYFVAIETKYLPSYLPIFLKSLPLILVVKSIVFYLSGMYKPVWRYASTSALFLIFKAATLGTGAVIVALFLFRLLVPRSILIVDWMLTILLSGFTKMMIRVIRERGLLRFSFGDRQEKNQKEKVLIYGAGDAGEMILREINLNSSIHHFHAVGFIDDLKGKGGRIHDVPILGTLNEMPKIVKDEGIDEVIIAIPFLSGEKMREVVAQCRELGVRFKVIPRIGDIVNRRIATHQLRDVEISDLLKRPPQNLNQAGIENLIRGKKILITGAGGSIGKELSLQIAAWHPAEIILLEHSEHNLYSVKTALNDNHPSLPVSGFLCSVVDEMNVQRCFAQSKPEIVFHAAAYKHVHLCEDNICQSVINNVLGTMRIADASVHSGVEKFIFISSDKAVNPTGIMGATKRIGELYLQSLGSAKTQFITVRFGNVLESSGSAVLRFKEQIRHGGPVTVTHPEITRYFMLLDEAVQLVLQSASMGQGGEIFVLDMGAPIRIVDLVRDLISLMGLRPEKDIKIEFTGLREGEKLYEELYDESQEVEYAHSGIMKVKPKPFEVYDFYRQIDKLNEDAFAFNAGQCLRSMESILPEFRQSTQRPRPSVVHEDLDS